MANFNINKVIIAGRMCADPELRARRRVRVRSIFPMRTSPRRNLRTRTRRICRSDVRSMKGRVFYAYI